MPNVRLTTSVCLQAGGAPGVVETRTGAPGDLLEGLSGPEAAFLVTMRYGVIEAKGSERQAPAAAAQPAERIPQGPRKRR
jgi:hypothetical protein